MKDYGILNNSFLNREPYILYYEINENGKIKVYYSGGVKQEFNYTKELETSLLMRMRAQVYEYAETVQEYRDDKHFLRVLTGLYGSATSCQLLSVICGMFSSSDTNFLIILKLITIFGLGLSTALYAKMGFENWDLLKDFDKTKLFLDNEELIKEYLKSLDNTETNIQTIKIPTVNDVETMKYKEVKDLVKQANNGKKKVLIGDINN